MVQHPTIKRSWDLGLYGSLIRNTEGEVDQTRNEPPHDKTNKWHVRPVKTKISLGIHPVWSESSLCTQWVAKDPGFLHVDSKDSDQTGWMPRLIWVFAGCTCNIVGFVTRRLKCLVCKGEYVTHCSTAIPPDVAPGPDMLYEPRHKKTCFPGLQPW